MKDSAISGQVIIESFTRAHELADRFEARGYSVTVEPEGRWYLVTYESVCRNCGQQLDTTDCPATGNDNRTHVH